MSTRQLLDELKKVHPLSEQDKKWIEQNNPTYNFVFTKSTLLLEDGTIEFKRMKNAVYQTDEHFSQNSSEKSPDMPFVIIQNGTRICKADDFDWDSPAFYAYTSFDLEFPNYILWYIP